MSDVTLDELEQAKKDEQRAETIEKVEEEVAEWVVRLARFGYMAKGAVYIILGLLAAQAAITIQLAPDTDHALEAIAVQPFGMILLALTIFGLSGYILWRFIMAVMDPEKKGTGPQGLVQRGGYIVSGLTYAGIAFTAIEILLSSRSSDNQSTADWTAWLLQQPFGDWMIGLAGLTIIGVGVEHLHRGYTAGFNKYCDFTPLGKFFGRVALHVGRYGLAARGIIYGIVGGLLVQSALEYDPNEVEGLGSALRWLESQPFGPYVLLALALGLMAYGLFAMAEGYCRRIVEEDIIPS